MCTGRRKDPFLSVAVICAQRFCPAVSSDETTVAAERPAVCNRCSPVTWKRDGVCPLPPSPCSGLSLPPFPPPCSSRAFPRLPFLGQAAPQPGTATLSVPAPLRACAHQPLSGLAQLMGRLSPPPPPDGDTRGSLTAWPSEPGCVCAPDRTYFERTAHHMGRSCR